MDLATLSNLDTSWSAGIPILERAFSKRRERRAIDPDTPKAAYSKKGQNGKEYWLVFSDEFNTDGRTFKEGDDPFWTAADMHYKATKNLEYLNPGQVTTQGGYLTITLDKVADPAKNHGFKYSGGMLTSWNQYVYHPAILLFVCLLGLNRRSAFRTQNVLHGWHTGSLRLYTRRAGD